MLRARAALLAELRQFFRDAGYWEVETPLLSRDVVVDAWLEPFAVTQPPDGGPSRACDHETVEQLYLQTSPEFGMKRLLAAGATSIYQITRAFRAGEVGRNHNPEFTIVEWYRVGDTYHDQMTFVEQLTDRVLAAADRLAESDGRPHLAPPFLRLSYDAAFERFAGTRVLNLSTGRLAELAAERGVTAPHGLRQDDRDGWLNLLLAELVEPHLGRDAPVFLYDYPASQAALARVRGGDPAVAERFELYIAGVEICNGYQELTDSGELRARTLKQAAIRSQEGLPKLPTENRLLSAMDAGLPESSGVALGFDRLAMLALGASSIADVMSFPFHRA